MIRLSSERFALYTLAASHNLHFHFCLAYLSFSLSVTGQAEDADSKCLPSEEKWHEPRIRQACSSFLTWKSFTFWNDGKTNIIRWNRTERRLREEYAPKGFTEAPGTIWTRGEKSFGSFLTFLEPVLGSEDLVISWLSEPFKFAHWLCRGILAL